jgi:multiple sugar transport system ATP-binding protein
MNGLRIHKLGVRFGRSEGLAPLDLEVGRGEVVVVFGPSGAGKTVLLRAIAGLLPQAEGEIWIDGEDVSALGPDRRRIGMAFQNFALYPHLTARDNIASPLRARRLPEAEIEHRLAAIAALLRIGHVLDHLPRALSNGQKQRTSLARALIARPAVLLLDDPLRNVDAKLRYEMRLEFPRLLRESHAATLFVTQDYREAMALGSRVALLRQGRLVQCAPPAEIYDQPADREIARLFGDPPINLLPAEPREAMGRPALAVAGSLLSVPALPLTRGPFQVGIRPETLLPVPAATPDAIPFHVTAVTPLHERTVLLGRAPDGAEIVASLTRRDIGAGETLFLRPDPHRLLFFDAASGARLAALRPVREAVP